MTVNEVALGCEIQEFSCRIHRLFLRRAEVLHNQNTCMQPFTEDIFAQNHRANHCNYASDQLSRSGIITPIFSLCFDGNSSANGGENGCWDDASLRETVTAQSRIVSPQWCTCQTKDFKGTDYIVATLLN